MTTVHRKVIRSWFQGWQVFRTNHQRWLVIVGRNDMSYSTVFCSQKHAVLGLSDIPSEIWTYLLRSVKAAPKCITCDTKYCYSLWNYCHSCQDWMAAVCKLFSFATVIVPVSLYCLALYYWWLWSSYVWLTEGLPLRLSTACFWEQERGIKLQLLKRRWPIIFGGWCGTSDG